MAQYDLNLGDYERIFRKRYRMVLAILIMVMGFTLFFSHLKPSIYKAASTVKVDRTSTMGVGEEMVIAAWDNIETQTKVVRSFPVVKRAAIRMGRVPKEFLSQETTRDPAVLAEVNALVAQLTVDVETGTNIIQIDAVSTDPSEAKDLANAVAEAYKEFALVEKRSQISKTRNFIEVQLEKCRQELSLAENSTREFEESQNLPKVSDEIQKTITAITRAESQIEDFNDKDRLIKGEMDRLNTRLSHPFTGLSHPGKDSTAVRDSSRYSKPGEMNWLSEMVGSDAGLASLNNRLIQYQLSMEDQMVFYRRDHPSIVDLEKKTQETIRQILTQLEFRRKTIQTQRAQVQAKLGDLTEDLGKLPSNEMEYARLIRHLRISEDLHSILSKRLQESQIAEAGVVDDVTIMSYAPQPSNPINKNYGRILLIGLVLGLLLGTILAIIREMLDTSIGTIEEVERHLNIPVLAVIPHIHMDVQEEKLQKKFNNRPIAHLHDRARLITQFDPKNPAAEAYRILRTNLHFLAADREVKTILVTSSAMQEGKSTTISNLAIAMAQEGKKTLLIGCNLRRPTDYRIFGLPKGPGTADILIDRVGWRECVRTVSDIAVGEFNIEDILSTPGIENLNIITFGQIPPNPSELISSKRMDQFLQEVRKEYDVILVDSPPLLPVADGSLLATKVDGVILVYQVGKAPRNSLWRGKERLESVKARILGVVLNDIRPEISGASYVSQYYMHYYGEPTNRLKSKKPVAPAKTSAWAFWAGIIGGMGAGLPGFVERLGHLAQSTILRVIATLAILLPAGYGITKYLSQTHVADAIPSAYAAEAKQQPVMPSKVAPTRPSSVALDTFYTCQLSTWETTERARGVHAKLETKQVASWVDSLVEPGKKTIYRVCAGRFDSLSHAKAYASACLEQQFKDFFYTQVIRPKVTPLRTVFVQRAVTAPMAVAVSKPDKDAKVLAVNTDSSGIFHVQFHSFQEEQMALDASTQMLRKGIPTSIERAEIPGKGVYYRVYAGPFKTKTDAKDFLSKVSSTSYRNAFISVRLSRINDASNAGG